MHVWPNIRCYLALTMMPLLFGCHLFGQTYRYRITVEVDTPQGIKVGSAVREITYRRGIKLPDSSGVVVTQQGEAVTVDLPKGQTMFVLLSVDTYTTLQMAFGGDSPEILEAAQKDGRIGVVKALPTRQFGLTTTRYDRFRGFPQIVRFTDRNDPSSVEGVRPDNLQASFGQGVRLRKITLQMTTDPITEGIQNRLPWLADYSKRHANLKNDSSGIVGSNDLAENLGAGEFKIDD